MILGLVSFIWFDQESQNVQESFRMKTKNMEQ